MRRFLIVECLQEIATFNPLQSEYENFQILKGEEVFGHRGLNTAIGGALTVFDADAETNVVPAMTASAGSAGSLSAKGWEKLSAEILESVKSNLTGVDGIYVSLHGAMGAEDELDPEGFLLEEIRWLAGRHIPIVISLDLHGILTDRMIRQVDGFTIYQTYPHIDFADTGMRAAKLLLRIVAKEVIPVITRCAIPALVRGDELITKTGCYGDLIGQCQQLEQEGMVLAAGIMIGNPFTDAPELCSQVLVLTDGKKEAVTRIVLQLAQDFWALRHRMQSKLIDLETAIEEAGLIDAPVVFTDAADATSSGASGDSNIILHKLIEKNYTRRVLAQIVDPVAAAESHTAGVGAEVGLRLGGAIDPDRFVPLQVKARVQLLSDGTARLETMKSALNAGPTAVLEFENITLVVISNSVNLFDRAIYFSNGLNPKEFDLIIVKSPHTEHHMYDAWVAKNFNIDVPGATSANLRSLGHTICNRPIFPLDDDVEFIATPSFYW